MGVTVLPETEQEGFFLNKTLALVVPHKIAIQCIRDCTGGIASF